MAVIWISVKMSLADKLRSPEDQVNYLQENRIFPTSSNCLACDIVLERVKKFQIMFGVGVFLMSQSQEWNFSFWQEDRDFSWLVFSPISNSSMKCPWRLPTIFQDKQREKDLSNHSIVPWDIQVSFFYFWSCLFLMILFVMMMVI